MSALIGILLACATGAGLTLLGLRCGIQEERRRHRATIGRVRAAVHVADAMDVTDWQRGYRACSERALAAIRRSGGAS